MPILCTTSKQKENYYNAAGLQGVGVSLLFVLLLVHAQDQTGFISIDCGRLDSSSYNEEKTGITYVSDSSFIDSGESKSISLEYKDDNHKQLWYLRSFPLGIRNCYNIENIKNGTKYLIRTSFLYGNYDGLNRLPEFELYLGANLWDSVKLEKESTVIEKEIIHVPLQNYIHVCVVNKELGTPFLSSIELRPLSFSYYKTQNGSLGLLYRWNTGPKSNRGYRYPWDVYDRFWHAYRRDDWTNISTQFSVVSEVDTYKLPSVVMSTAATPKSENGSLEYWLPNDTSARYYVYMHIAELENLQLNQSRQVTVSYGGQVSEPKSPAYLQSTTILTTSGYIGGQPFIISRTPSSTHPPIISAIEVYVVKSFFQSDTLQTDAEAMTKLKSPYGVKRNWQGDPCVPELYLWEGLNCSKDGYNNPPRIISLNLSSSGLTGEIPLAISNLTMLEVLDLSDNNFTGSLPEFLSKFPNLRILNLEKNNLNGSVPIELIEKSNGGSLELSVGQNPNLCVSVSCKKKKKNAVVPVVASVVATFTLLVIMGAIYWAAKRKLKHVDVTADERSITAYSSLELKKRQFTWSEILGITKNFERVLGQGGFGTVFYGVIDCTEVAVKVLTSSSVQGYQQFHAEVNLLTRVHHKNITSLVGYCNDGTNAALIYEYMANGNLKTHISDDSSSILKWEDRLRIALDAAQGLEYLHAGCKPPIVHRDVKSTNILLNDTFQAKLSDLGISKLFITDSQTHVTTKLAGTAGYLDPEYYMSNWLNEKSDVYSYGVVLLEIISSRPAVAKTYEKTHISTWVNSMLAKGDIKSIADRRLQGNFDTNSVWKTVELAMACVSTASTKRPTMSQVVAELRECLAAERAHEITDSIELLPLNMTSELRPLAR